MPRSVSFRLQTAAEKNAEIIAAGVDLYPTARERANHTFFGWDSSEYSRMFFEHGSAYVNVLNFGIEPIIENGTFNLTYQYDGTWLQGTGGLAGPVRGV